MKVWIFLFSMLAGVVGIVPKEETKPLLRVLPAYRAEECQAWAIRPFTCLRCLEKGMRYAQMIRWDEERPLRVHGCFSEEGGFVPEGQN